jgi:hypothetical protein
LVLSLARCYGAGIADVGYGVTVVVVGVGVAGLLTTDLTVFTTFAITVSIGLA